MQDDTIRVAFHNEQKSYEWAPPSAHVVAPLTLEHTIFGEAFSFLRDTVTTALPKLTIPSLSMVHYRGGRSAIDESVYPDLDQFWADLAAAYAEEVRRLYDLGCRYLQFDDTSLAYMNDPAQRQHVAEIGGDPEHQHERYIENINRALAGRPGRPGGHHPHVPGQQPEHVGGRGRLRVRRRGAVQRAGRGRVLL